MVWSKILFIQVIQLFHQLLLLELFHFGIEIC